MYNKETKTFKFPNDQKRIDGVVAIANSEAAFHTRFIKIRNDYYVRNEKKIGMKYRFREKVVIDYFDGMLDRTRYNLANIAMLLCREVKLIPKGDKKCF